MCKEGGENGSNKLSTATEENARAATTNSAPK